MKKILGVVVVCLGLGLFGASSAQAVAISLVDGDVIKTAENPNV